MAEALILFTTVSPVFCPTLSAVDDDLKAGGQEEGKGGRGDPQSLKVYFFKLQYPGHHIQVLREYPRSLPAPSSSPGGRGEHHMSGLGRHVH